MSKIFLILLIVFILVSIESGNIGAGTSESLNTQIYDDDQNVPKPPTSRISPFRHFIGTNDEGSHNRNNSYHQEWWYYIGFFNGNESELKNGSMMISFNQMGEIDILFCTIFEESNNISYGGTITGWKGTMTASRPNVDVQFLNSTVKGRYPKWNIYAEYKKPNEALVTVNVTYQAKSLPMWLFTNTGYNISKSYFGHYCIINSDIQGTVTINETFYNVHGRGYHEHSWVNVKQQTNTNPGFVLQKHTHRTNDVPAWQLLLDAWDWGSIFLDNDWNIFVAKICQQSTILRSVPGSLWITPDGDNVTECRYFQFQYLETCTTSIPEIEIPTKIHIKAFFLTVFLRNPLAGLIRLDLNIETENLREFTWHGKDVSIGVWECPCKLYGSLEWGINRIELNGCAMLEITRAHGS